MKVTLMGPDDDGCFFLCDYEGREYRLVRQRKDHAAAAALFGWKACECGQTDGTVACEHRTVREMIAEARGVLMDHIGDDIEAPAHVAAYFDELDKDEEE